MHVLGDEEREEGRERSEGRSRLAAP